MFEVDIEGFSGPLDLLCHLVERRELDPRGIKVGQVVALYSAWLGQVGGVTIDQLGEFISVAARLVLEKTLAIAPPPAPLPEEDDELLQDWGDEDLADLLERYRPYRAAAGYLAERWRAQSGRRFRPQSEILWRPEYGDVFALAVQWRDLLTRHAEGALSLFEDEGVDGVPDAIPDVGQVEHVMERVVERLQVLGPTRLSALLEGNRGRGPLAVTLLALLELARQHRVTLHQEEMFGDVSVQLQQTVETA